MSALPQLRFYTLDVFTASAFCGNPLAVVLGAEQLNRTQMQTIAREFNLSETVFVLPPTRPDCRYRLRIFTPATELPFAGHPTVGAACLLASLHPHGGADVRNGEQHFAMEENAGPVPVMVRAQAQQPVYAELTTPRLPTPGAAPPQGPALMAALGLASEDLAIGKDPYGVFDGGVAFLLVPVRTPELLAGIEVDAQRLRQLLGGDARGVYVYARGYEGELRARMFAPAVGIAEDPATGAAAAALAGALGMAAERDGRHEWCIHQGLEMGRPSQLYISVDRLAGAITAVRVGGHAVTIGNGMLRHPQERGGNA